MKLTRRQLLLTGLVSGVATTGMYQNIKYQRDQQQQEDLERQAQDLLLKKYTETEQNAQKNLDSLQDDEKQLLQADLPITAEPATLTAPKLPYNRELSKLLIQCCRISTEQYTLGKLDPRYDGAIKRLPTYSPRLDGYRQVAALIAPEDDVSTQDVELLINPDTGKPVAIAPTPTSATPAQDSPNKDAVNPATGQIDPVERNLRTAEGELDKTIKRIVKVTQKIPVYYGYVLTSRNNHIVVFRGTNRIPEWIQNLFLFQADYEQRGYGKVHSGFSRLYESLALQLRGVIANLNPALPLYITGHSLGAAMATLAAIDTALNLPHLKQRIQLYTYASPRVGDPAFATKHSQLIPNSYRVFNLSDLFPSLPPISTPEQKFLQFQMEAQTFSHIGQKWSFVANLNDLDLNHRIDTYRAAILRQLETDQPRKFPISGLS